MAREFVIVQQGSGANKAHISRFDSERPERLFISCGSRRSGSQKRIVARCGDADADLTVKMVRSAFGSQACEKCITKVGA